MAKVAVRVAKDPVPVKADFDLRDRLAELVTKGNVLSPDDKAAIYGSLVSSLGKDKAAKVMNHAYIFNTRPEVQKLPLEEKIKSFYTVGSSDPDVMDVMGRTKNLGYGVGPGFRDSVSDINKATQSGGTATGTVNPEVARKIMVKIGR